MMLVYFVVGVWVELLCGFGYSWFSGYVVYVLIAVNSVAVVWYGFTFA